MTRRGTELHDIETTMSLLEEWREALPRQISRLRAFMPLENDDPILDVGAAQGVTSTALKEFGFTNVRGVEPSREALETRHELMERTGITTDIVQGVAEKLPFEDDQFQYVHVYSVMEHVDDPWQVFRECYRVTRPGGGFFFNTTSAISPFQAEIDRFPLFPWYPDPVRRGIMNWAMREKPWLVGYTDRPAFFWFKHREVQQKLRECGFKRVHDMWELRSASGEATGRRKTIIDAAAHNRAAKLLGNIGQGGMQYLAIK